MSNESQDKRRFQGRFLTGLKRYQYQISTGAGIILGLIFVASGVGKILEPTEFLSMLLKTLLLSWNQSVLIAGVLPWVELLLGISLILGISIRFMSGVSFLLVIGFIFQNVWVIGRKLATDDCGCFGGLDELLKLERQITLSAQGALYMDIGMLALSLIVLFGYPDKFFTLTPWFMRRAKSRTT